MDCREASEMFGAYLDGELMSQAGEGVRDHLAACPRCAADLAQLKRLNHVLDALEGMAAPANFSSRVRAAAASHRVAREAGPQPAFGPARRVLMQVAAGVMIAAGLWVGVTMGGAMGLSAPASATAEEAQSDELDLQVNALAAAPAGSVAGTYLAFASESE